MEQRLAGLEIDNTHELYGILQMAKKSIGFELNDGNIMAHTPKIAKAFLGLTMAILEQGSLSPEFKRMIGFMTSLAGACEYCQSHTAFSSQKYGVSQEKLNAIWEFETSELFTEKERAAYRVALKSSMVPNQVDDEDFKKLKQHFSDEEIVELVSVISFYAFLNRYNATFNTQIEEEPQLVMDKLNIRKNA